MSFEAVTNIAQAEEAAKAAVAYAQTKARQMVLDAESSGRAQIEKALERAESELAELAVKTEEKSS